MKALALYRGGPEPVGVVLVDDRDAHWGERYRLRLSTNGYVYAGAELLHRRILGLVPRDGKQGDHRNRDLLDCTRSNLRVTDNAGNGQNVPGRPGSSRFRGVSWWQAKGLWQAYVTVRGRKIKLGYSRDEIEAAKLAEAGRRELMPFAEPDPELAAVLA